MSNIDKYTQFISEQARRGDTAGLRSITDNDLNTHIRAADKGSEEASRKVDNHPVMKHAESRFRFTF